MIGVTDAVLTALTPDAPEPEAGAAASAPVEVTALTALAIDSIRLAMTRATGRREKRVLIERKKETKAFMVRCGANVFLSEGFLTVGGENTRLLGLTDLKYFAKLFHISDVQRQCAKRQENGLINERNP
jgi:hypothetical protein